MRLWKQDVMGPLSSRRAWFTNQQLRLNVVKIVQRLCFTVFQDALYLNKSNKYQVSYVGNVKQSKYDMEEMPKVDAVEG